MELAIFLIFIDRPTNELRARLRFHIFDQMFAKCSFEKLLAFTYSCTSRASGMKVD